VEVKNPFNPKQTRRVSLKPEDVDLFVFWTRDPRPLLEHGPELEDRGYRFYVLVTLTGYPAVLEPNPPPEEAVMAAMRDLSGRFGADRVIWRYDPLFLSTATPPAFHAANFSALAAHLSGTAGRVIISVYDEYKRARRRIAVLESAAFPAFKQLPHYEADGGILPEIRTLLADLAESAARRGMILRSCGEACSVPGIEAGACIDGGLIGDLWGIEAPGRDKNQRPHCRCVSAVDIGSYGPCPAGCVYCYARI
jgi:hypothetical protein